MKPKAPVYSPVSISDHTSCSEDSESPLVEKGGYEYRPSRGSLTRHQIYRVLGETSLLLLSIGFFVAAALRQPSERGCVEKLSTFSTFLYCRQQKIS